MHRGLPEGNTKLVLILTRPCALSDHWARSSRIPSQSFCSDPGASRSIRWRHSRYELYMYAYDMPIKCTWNKNKILQSQSNYRSSINATIYLQLRLSSLVLPVRPVPTPVRPARRTMTSTGAMSKTSRSILWMTSSAKDYTCIGIKC